MGKLGWNSGYIGSDQRTTPSGSVGYGKFYLERLDGRFNPVLEFSEGLLDLYPNAAAAYSLRRLSVTYNSSVIRVRRSSDNAEQDIGFVGGNLDTNSLLSFVGGSSGFVTTWYDQSGNGRNAIQTTATNQPQIINGGIIITQGTNPALRFDGLNDLMTTPQFAYSSSVSMYYVTQRVGNASGGSPYNPDISMYTTDFTDGGAFHYVNPTLKGASYPFFPNFGNYDGSGSYANGDKYLINFELTNNVGFNVYRNNLFEGGNLITGSIPITTQGFYIAHQNNPTRYAHNNFCEIIMWNSNQSVNRSIINSNINSYYSIY